MAGVVHGADLMGVIGTIRFIQAMLMARGGMIHFIITAFIQDLIMADGMAGDGTVATM